MPRPGRNPLRPWARQCALSATLLAAAACSTRTAGRVVPVPPVVPALAADLDAILNNPALAHGIWGVTVRSMRTHETLYARNGEKLLMPASTMKIVTLAAAAARLGWEFTYRTTLSAAGAIEEGTLRGDLVVVGSGDPGIGTIDGTAAQVFGSWAQRLTQLGVRTIAGRIIGDDNAFEDLELGFGWSWDDLAEDYAAGVSALQYNENAVRVTVGPGPAEHDSAAVVVEPPGAGIEIVNAIRTAAREASTSIAARRLPGHQRLALEGIIAAGATPSVLTVSVDNPTLFFVQALRRALIAQGIDVRGEAVDIDDLPPGTAPARRMEIVVHRSPPLSMLAVRLMKASQNQYAETFLKTIATADQPDVPATALAGRLAAQKIFASWGIDEGSLIQRDGSGLSRYDYVTADALATILTHLYEDEKSREPFIASLPVAGEDGTLGGRMKGTSAGENARAKTGSMSNVRALAGYVNAADGEPLAFAILANNFDSPPRLINDATDAIVVRLAQFRR
jgi:D-alanyl-D-alanine carboxypeptidase/D-alanyl-D-alanine-endopeptidase (penicillin-binding protein 4)